ncbi:hypothetical protein Pmar_PMAR000078 [Perkinsus marinus ATCC 50983]|uniref:Uncharacterized protein n=1 Tax=Perkinsus marinus (strain ATCC 50983 / TXsc) TaxID=423536 RepID=C5KPU4_PERM5|nr:hypothetical protein Pmar_PMAR000078 [Perkinsus marinus ATCC 50983]EER13491.1 hypothetical protein Pmar_PMAR000078 [Perkinsus marinus ATCC 50983]|eukprot:XP_002781696.1 hypothetical protein Pmar_PMAR000078 [Perkinsus marinus ATCC 50983]
MQHGLSCSATVVLEAYGKWKQRKIEKPSSSDKTTNNSTDEEYEESLDLGYDKLTFATLRWSLQQR